jgi:membrane fusion protein (multidrug efflux system)
MSARDYPIWLGLALLLPLTGCSESESQPADSAAPPPQQVTVIELLPRDLPARFEYVGRLEASREVEIHPRVTGMIEQRLFDEGGRVEAGQPLFQLDRAPFEARKQVAQAALAEANARLIQAEREVKRLTPLVKALAVSQRDLDDARSTRELNRAGVAAARAELSLDYTRVDAPIAGRTGRALQVEGSLVSSTSEPLVRLAQIDPLHVRFSIAENERLEIDRQVTEGSLKLPPPAQTRVEVKLADGSTYPLSGQVDFSDRPAHRRLRHARHAAQPGGASQSRPVRACANYRWRAAQRPGGAPKGGAGGCQGQVCLCGGSGREWRRYRPTATGGGRPVGGAGGRRTPVGDPLGPGGG